MTVLEESTSLAGRRMCTVRTKRGDEYVIDADAAVEALAEMFSEFDNERRFGWTLHRAWWEVEYGKLRTAATA
jgi:hypothetical protein